MNEFGQASVAFPRPGPALKAVLLTIAVVGIFSALLIHWIPGGERIFLALVCTTDALKNGEVWRFLTAGLLTGSLGHLFFTLIGLYFLSPDLERRLGSWRFLGFLALSTTLGFLLAIALDAIAPTRAEVFHPPLMYGAGAAITATAIAWARAHEHQQVRLFFFLPLSGKQLFWVTIGICVLAVVYSGGSSEGVVAPFGGIVTGLLFTGSPSAFRQFYLQLKIAYLRRRTGMSARSIAGLAPSPKRGRSGAKPPLRVVSGGIDDDFEKRKPPKDKRYLN